MTKIIKEIPFGQAVLRLETGEIARQANSAVLVSWQDTVVLVTVVAAREANEGRDFFPLTVNYQERSYAAGKIPGGFLKREGRPSEQETLISRMIDRPLRPLFPKGFYNDVQVVASVVSYNPEVNPDILAMIGASAAVTIAGLPFAGPIAAVRVGYHEGVYQLNPTNEKLKESKLDLVVAGTQEAVLMVESEAKELSEQVMLGAVMFGHEMMQPVIQAINELAEEVGNPPWECQPPEANAALENQVQQLVAQRIPEAYQVRDKSQRSTALKAMQQETVTQLTTENEALVDTEILDIIKGIEKKYVRGQILAGEPRIDGRDTKTVRPISIRTGLLPRAHGSVLFTRGETQALVTVTLGNERDAQLLDTIRGDGKQRYMLHYNFPPYSVGETGMMGSPKRREIGHGNLARRATQGVLPDEDKFPYVLRVVSEITESNGSSSMASVCGTSLALMDAGVTISAPVAGIAMGLIKEGEQYAVLTDILGDEDHLGDMDFKVAGTVNGITALQMDIKISGITQEIMDKALNQALEARQHILGIMDKAISEPRAEVSPHAPRFHHFKIDPDKIRDVIGKGGVTIRAITEETGVSIDIDDDGTIKLFSPDQTSVDQALVMIKGIVADVEVNKIYQGTVMKIVDFGAFVSVLPGKEGLLHISQISEERIGKVSDILNEGQQVTVKVLAVEPNGRIKLSMKAVESNA